ncbi:hypothetical protein PIB30_008405 [Stylosanthes scabra]|uniref:GRF-type domain-containing protein n=1 Tax=Stylosanthes scabra TaxID=79078 RepID=A0ABU6V5L4_9FABA|nr:hypothetical protein [Stylosanthes scabra]
MLDFENFRCSHRSSKWNAPFCGHGMKALLRVSRTKENPGRRFWGCPRYEVKESCGFFDWADVVSEEEDAEKAKLRKKVRSLKLKLKKAEMKMKVAVVVGMIECVLLMLLWFYYSATNRMLCP